ncbi:hypothetical protein GW17_00015699 [Ensete ventricosum]|nr:hypothetical protein GW17_00015699 [Ensete ventricosum]
MRTHAQDPAELRTIRGSVEDKAEPGPKMPLPPRANSWRRPTETCRVPVVRLASGGPLKDRLHHWKVFYATRQIYKDYPWAPEGLPARKNPEPCCESCSGHRGVVRDKRTRGGVPLPGERWRRSQLDKAQRSCSVTWIYMGPLLSIKQV